MFRHDLSILFVLTLIIYFSHFNEVSCNGRSMRSWTTNVSDDTDVSSEAHPVTKNRKKLNQVIVRGKPEQTKDELNTKKNDERKAPYTVRRKEMEEKNDERKAPFTVRTKEMEEARQKAKDIERQKLTQENIKNKMIEKQKNKEVDEQRDSRKEKKMDKTKAMGKNQPSRRISNVRSPKVLVQARADPNDQQTTDIYTKSTRLVEKEDIEVDLLNPHSLARQLRSLMSRAEYTNVTVTTIGVSAEYNDIVLLKAADLQTSQRARLDNDADKNKFAEETPQKKIILIVHGLSVMGFKDIPCLIKVKRFLQLLKAYFDHLNKFDIFVVPMANPDGVLYTYQNPLWNKNVSPQEACPGVNLDRNFDMLWNSGPPVKSCSQLFPGDHPFSEAETSAIKDILHNYGHKIVAYIHVHGSGYHEHIFKGEAVLYPKGYSDAQGDDDRYVDLKGELDDMMKNASFKVMSMTVDTLYNWYGKVTGTSVDYVSSVYGIPFALEFVMQVYNKDPYVSNSEEDLPVAAQTEIWHRTIDIIFKYIYKITAKKYSFDSRREVETKAQTIGF